MSQYKAQLRRNLFAAINNALMHINEREKLRQYRANNAHGEMLRRVQSASPLELAPTPSSNAAKVLLELVNSSGVPKVNIAKNTPPKPKRSKSTSNLPRNNR